jgi:hypothetical protein
MPRVTKKECWNILEDKLQGISEQRMGAHSGESKLAVSVLVSSGRDEDLEFINSNLFNFYCQLGALHIKPTRELILNTLKYLNEGGSARFRLVALDD